MNGIWSILELEPTKDISAIKRAYARKAKICHPEEDPEGFLELRKAYQAALDDAEQGELYLQEPSREQKKRSEESGEKKSDEKEPDREGAGEEKPDAERLREKELKREKFGEEKFGEEKFKEEKADEEKSEEEEGWLLSEELPAAGDNPLRDGEAIRRFTDLYTGTQRKKAKLWMDYFTSDVFLDVAWDSRFTALMLEKVMETEQDIPPDREFQMWLDVVYQVSAKAEPAQEQFQSRRRAEPYPEAGFHGMESVLRIAAKGPMPKRLGGDELAVRESFQDYRHLVRLADSGSWNEQALEEFKWIVDRYSPSYIKERCDVRANPDYQCHPAGLRVFTHFFQRCDLPEEIYRIVWRKLRLKSMNAGRMKILYGSLRELVTERVPDIEGEEPRNLLQLSRDRNACFSRIQADPEQEERELAVYFSQENIQKALRSRWFVEEQLLACSSWLDPATPEGAVRWLAEFYRENQDIWGWNRVVERAEQELERREKERKQEAEEAAEAVGSEEWNLSLLPAFPKRVYAKPLTGPERVFRPYKKFGTDPEDEPWKNLMTDSEWEASGEKWEYREKDELLAALGGAEKEEGEDEGLLTEERLKALFGQFAEGELTRLEIEFDQTTLVLVRDQDKYACFCFEESDDTWYSMLSQPEVYKTVDCKMVEYMPFGMGKLAGYSIHESPASILRNLNLVFMQIGRGGIQVRMGDCWLWSSHTSQQNGRFKKYMAMQKLALIPDRHQDNYILGKFVFSQYPDRMESVSLSGERTLERLRPGNYDLAASGLAQFFQKKLAKLRLSWESKGKKAGTGLRHIVLLQDGGQFMMAWLQDGREQAGFYASDTPRIFLGRVYPACLVHRDLKRIRNCLDMILDDVACAELVTDRPGEFVPTDCPYSRIREEMVDEKA